MIANLSLICLAFAALTQASFTPPEGIANGFYVHDPATGEHSTIDGTVVARDLDSRSAEPGASLAELGDSAKLLKRWKGIVCGSTTINNLDYASAYQAFADGCDGKTPYAAKNYYSVYGQAMIYMCNYKSGNKCVVSKISDNTDWYMGNAFDAMNKKCSAAYIAANSESKQTGYNRIDNVSWGLTTASGSAC